MTEKKEEWEIGYSRENPATPSEKAKTAKFEKIDALVGQLLDGRFLIEKDLTEGGADAGGIGLVYLAQDLKLMGKQVVVKILQKAALENEDMVRKFQHEKEALIRLDHPNIVRILDSGTLSDGNPFMVMEYIAGYSLRHLLKERGKLSFDFIAHIAESVTDALSAAHSQKILHRDIKPENIMLTPPDEGFERVRLIDFGIARVEDSLLAPATTIPRGIGTILYIAPEQLLGKLEQTPAADIYAFGIVVYEMLTGELPFQPQSVVEMFELQKQSVKNLPRQLRSDLSEEAESILLSALEFEAEKRPQNARQFGRELAKSLRKNLSEGAKETSPELAQTEPIISEMQPNPLIAPTEASIPENQTDFSISNIHTPPRKSSTKLGLGLLLGALILSGIAAVIGLAYWKSSSSPSVTNQTPTANTNHATSATNANATPSPTENIAPVRELSYFLNVQKMRDGKPFEAPFKSSGQEIFESGYKFKMLFQADADGFFYLFNEEKTADGTGVYNILYPTPKTNNGSAEIRAKMQIETSQNTFGANRGTEIVWLIWTAKKQDDLETVRQAAFDGQGVVKEEKNVRLLSDFVEKYPKAEANKDSTNQQTIVKGKGDVIVYRIELEHR